MTPRARTLFSIHLSAALVLIGPTLASAAERRNAPETVIPKVSPSPVKSPTATSVSLDPNKASRFPRVATGDSFPPYVSRALPGLGLFPSLFAHIASRAGWTYTLRFAPWPRVERGVSDGTFDIAFPYVPTPSRMKEFLYSRPVVWVGADTGLFVRKGHALEGVGFAGAALAGVPRLRLCRVRGYAEAEELQTPEAKGRFVAVDSTSDEECLRFLLRGRVDAFFYGESRLPALFEQARLAPLDLGRMDVRFRGTSYHFIVSRRLPDAPARLAQLDAAIEEVLEGKEADELVRRFTTHDVLATGPYSSR